MRIPQHLGIANEDGATEWADWLAPRMGNVRGELAVIHDGDGLVELLSRIQPDRREIICGRLNGKSFEAIGRRFGFGDEWARQQYYRAEDALKVARERLLRYQIRELYHEAVHGRYVEQRSTPLKWGWSGARTVRDKGRVYTPEEVAAFVASRPDLQPEQEEFLQAA